MENASMTRIRRPIQLVLLVLIVGCGRGAPAWGQTAVPLSPEKALTQYRFDRWTAEQGLPMNRVQTLLQTSDGYVWAGTQEGLVRFDGFDFHIFDSKNSPLQSNDVGALAEDEEGNLWIATSYDGLARYRHGRFTSYRADDGLTSDQVYSVMVDRTGRVWAGTQSGVSVFENDTIAPLDVGSGFQGFAIRALHEDEEGVIWIGTQESGLIRLEGERYTTFTTSSGLPSDEVTSIAADRDGSVLVGTKGGLAIFDGGEVRTISSRDGLPNDLVRAIWSDGSGVIWIGNEEGGLSRFDRGKITTYPESRISSVFALLVDMEGSLWVGTQREGLVRLQDGKFTVFTAEEGLAGSSVYSVVEDTAGDIWVGTIDEGVSRIHDGRITSFTTENGFPTNSIGGMYASAGGDVWIGTRGAGLVRFRNGDFRHFTQADGLPDDVIYNIFEDSNGILWMGSYNEGLIRYDGRRFITYTTEDGLTDNAVTAVAEGPNGYLWLGTYRGGVNLMKDGLIIHTYTAADGLPQNNVNSIYRDEGGVVWIATQEGGLTRLQNGQLTTITTNEGLFSDNILQILEDDQGFLWFSSNTGLFKASKDYVHAVMDDEMEAIETEVYDRSDGLTTTEFNGGLQPAGWKDRNGNLWFVSARGLIGVDPDDMPINERAPPIVIERVVAGEDAVRLDTSVVLEPGRNRLEIDFIGLSYVANEEVVYRYMLEGVDNGWVEAGGRRQAFYTNLSPGPYTFHVLARNADGVWSQQPATFSFYLEPFFYQTWWFFGLMAIVLMLSGVGVYKLRVRQLKARQRELEQIVDERTRDLREEKEKVEQAKAVIEKQADQLREMDRVKTRFFGNISHEFRTPLTLNIGPLENALTGLYGPVPDSLKKQLNIMLRNARRLLRLINQLLDISKLESGRMELKPKRINIVQFLEGVVLSFTGFTEKQNIDLGFHADAEKLPVTFDPEAMEKVFFNLLSNAVKFTPEGGTIDVSIAVVEGGESAEVRVRDSGEGIPEKELPYIFDRFRQAEGSKSNVQQGTGIGLALVKELVELHEGQISVTSEQGEYTEFCIVIPIGEATDEPLADADAELGYDVSQGPMVELAVFDEENTTDSDAIGGDGAVSGAVVDDSRSTILVVDDNPDIREYMISCLTGTYNIVAAKDGREAYEKAQKVRPDLIISDVVMPNMTGYELCRAVRSNEEIKLTPIIMVTSKAEVEDKIEGLEAGADDYLPKPFNADELFARVSNLLTLRKQQKELKNLNEVLKETNVELRDASELKSQLLRIAAHDLKNPLNNIREFANLIREEIDTESEVGEMLGLIQSSSNKMLELISQILESEALESGQLEINRAPVDLAELAQSVVEENQRQAARKGQEIVFEATRKDEHLVLGSEEWLLEAMENLVSNAIKYSPTDEKIWVTVRRAEAHIEFEVRDQGPGLSEDDMELLFQKFQRLSAKPTGGESSTGLGLSIVKQIVEMHEGTVRVESELGAGSAFIIQLDATKNSVEA